MDQRTRITKEIIRESFIELLKTKKISQISVRELCDVSNINRSTFYRYYIDINALVEELENEIIGYFVFFDGEKGNPTILNQIEKCIEKIILNKDLYLGLIENGYIYQAFYQQAKGFKVNSSASPYHNLLVCYSVAGSFSLIQQWLLDNQSIDKKQLAKLIYDTSVVLAKMQDR